MKEFSHVHIVCLLHKLVTSSRGIDDLSFGFDRSRNRRKQEVTNNKNNKGKYHLRVYSRDIVGFAEQQVVATFGLGYRLTLTGNTDNAVLNKTNDTNKAKTKINRLNGMFHIIP